LWIVLGCALVAASVRVATGARSVFASHKKRSALRRALSPRRVLRAFLAAWVGALLGYLVYGWAWASIARWLPLPSWAACAALAFLPALLAALLAGPHRLSSPD
jgi:hypothetical protein